MQCKKIDTAVKTASTTGGVTKTYVDEAIATVNSTIEAINTTIDLINSQITTISNDVLDLKTKLDSALVLGATAAGVTADQYDKITSVNFK